LAGQDGRIISIEPVFENFEILKINSDLNKKFCKDFKAINAAVSDFNGQVSISRGNQSTLHTVVDFKSNESQIELADAFTLDTLIERLISNEPIMLIKVDVEGHEKRVIDGLKKTIEMKRIKNLIIEVFPGDDAIELANYFSELDMDVKVWQKNSWLRIPLETLTERTDIWVSFSKGDILH
jgi:FkbM family methyltransferase